MTLLVEVFGKVLLPILVVVSLGYLLRRHVHIDIRSVNRLSMYLFSPTLIFASLVQIQIALDDAIRISTFMVLFVLLMGAIAVASGHLLRLDSVSTSALMLCAMFMNAGNYGLPVSRFAFGEVGFQLAVVFFVNQAVLGQTLAVYIAASGNSGWRVGLQRLARMPQIYAVLVALLLRATGIELNPDGTRVVDELFHGFVLMSEATVPLLLVILGMQLAESEGISDRWRVALATAIRLVVSVPLAWALAWMLGLEGLAARVGVLMVSMPTAVNMTILAIEFNLRPRFVSSVVTTSTVVSLVSLTLLLATLR